MHPKAEDIADVQVCRDVHVYF